MRVAQRLAHELGRPVFALAVLGLQTGDYERHVVYWRSCKGTLKGSGKYGEACLKA